MQKAVSEELPLFMLQYLSNLLTNSCNSVDDPGATVKKEFLVSNPLCFLIDDNRSSMDASNAKMV